MTRWNCERKTATKAKLKQEKDEEYGEFKICILLDRKKCEVRSVDEEEEAEQTISPNYTSPFV